MTSADGDADLPGVGVGREPGDAEGQEDLVRGVGHRGQRVAGEHRQRDPLGQQRLVQPVAAHGAAEQEPLERVRRSGARRADARACRVPGRARARPLRRTALALSRGLPVHRRGPSGALRHHGLRPGRLDAGADPGGRRATRSPSSTRTSRPSAGWAPDFAGRRVTGIGFDRDTLREAGIEEAQAFAAVSSGDNSNILAARVARETFGVDNVVARIYDPGRAEVYQRLGIPTVATVRWTADQMLRRLLPHGAEPEWRDPSGTVRLAEVHVDTAWIGERVEPARGGLRGPGRVPHPARRGPAARRGHRAPGRRPRARRDARQRRGRGRGRAAPPVQRGALSAGRHRRSRQRRPLDRRASCSRTATRSCSSTRTRPPSSAQSVPSAAVAARRRLRGHLARGGRPARVPGRRSPPPVTTRSTWSCRCSPRPSTACRAPSPGSTTPRTSGCSTRPGASTSRSRRRA